MYHLDNYCGWRSKTSSFAVLRFKLQEQQEYEEGEPEYDEQGDEGQEHMEDYQECRNEDEYADEDQDQYPVNRLFPVQFTKILKFSSTGIRHVFRQILDY